MYVIAGKVRRIDCRKVCVTVPVVTSQPLLGRNPNVTVAGLYDLFDSVLWEAVFGADDAHGVTGRVDAQVRYGLICRDVEPKHWRARA